MKARIVLICLVASWASGNWANCQSNSEQAQIYGARGLAKAIKRDNAGAMADLDAALKLDPRFAIAYVGRAAVKVAMGNLDGATADYNRAIEFDPMLSDAYAGRANVKLVKGELDPAIADYNRAIELGSIPPETYVNRGNANYAARRWTDAVRDYSRFCEISRRGQEYPRLLIWLIRSRSGEIKTANKELAAYYKLASPGWTSQIAEYFLGNLSEVALLAAATSSNKDTDRRQHCEACFYIGMKKLLAGDKQGAADSFKKSVITEQPMVAEYRFAKSELNALKQ